MEIRSLGFIGGGRITKVFLQAFKNKSVKFDTIEVFDTDNEVLNHLKEQFSEITTTKSVAETSKQDIVILAVHPPVMMEILNHLKEILNRGSVVLSLAPKINIDKMTEILPTSRIVRMIPNATSFVNEGYNPVSFHHSFSSAEKEQFINTFNVLGYTFEVAEHKLEGYAIASAMLPTYFWFQMEKMEEIAEKTGLTTEEAKDTIYKTLKHANELFYNSGYTHEEIIDLIPVKPIGEYEKEINTIYETKLLGLFEKIKSTPAAEVS
jgi:pyrroline-5-carboxylate reductase